MPQGVAPLPTLEYLLECSNEALATLELKCLDLSAQNLKAAKAEMEQATANREAAGVCRWLIENRDDLINLSRRIIDGKQGLLRFPELAIRRSA